MTGTRIGRRTRLRVASVYRHDTSEGVRGLSRAAGMDARNTCRFPIALRYHALALLCCVL